MDHPMAHVVLNKDVHGSKRIKPLSSFDFLAKFPVVEVVMGEFSAAASVYPIFFVEREGSYAPIALLSLIDGQNMFVEPDGRWSGLYMPAAFRRYPFTIGPGEVNGQAGPALLIDEDSLSDSEGEAIFAADGQEEAATPLGRVLRLIAETDRSHAQTRALIAELKEVDVIRQADLSVNLDGQKHNIAGLYGVDEERLRGLSDEVFLKLRHSGALTLAHIQMQSVGQVQRLVQRHNAREAALRGGQPPAAPQD
jgi:hypothetical protein